LKTWAGPRPSRMVRRSGLPQPDLARPQAPSPWRSFKYRSTKRSLQPSEQATHLWSSPIAGPITKNVAMGPPGCCGVIAAEQQSHTYRASLTDTVPPCRWASAYTLRVCTERWRLSHPARAVRKGGLLLPALRCRQSGCCEGNS
jgi:hypothetical protein